MKEFRRSVLLVPCPKCRRGAGRWCRDEHGKVLHLAHAERSRAVLQQLAAPLAYVAKATAAILLILAVVACGGSASRAASAGDPPAQVQMQSGDLLIHTGDSFNGGYGSSACPMNGAGTCYVDLVMAHYSLTRQYNENSGCITATGTVGSECGTASYFGSLYSNYASLSLAQAQANPGSWILLEGGNHDASYLFAGIDPAVATDFQPQLDSIVSSFLQTTPADHIILVRTAYVKSAPGANPTFDQLNSYVVAVAQKYGVRVADFNGAMLGCEATCYISDGLHPNDAGYAAIATAIETAAVAKAGGQ